MELKEIIEKEVKKEYDDFLHCEAFQWCKGKDEIEEEYEEHEENLKQFAIFYGIVFVIMIIIMVILNKTMGIIWD